MGKSRTPFTRSPTARRRSISFINAATTGDVPQPDLILLEPQLPGKSGMEVIAELKDEPVLNEIPVVVLTSSKMGEDIVRSHGLEEDDEYIRKPVETDEFVEFVQSIEDFWFAIIKTDGDD